jgi:TetR/AcrR family transcriptional regulator
MASTTRKSPTLRKSKESSPRWKDALPSREDLQKLKKTALIRAAGQAFKAKGFHNTSLDDVAEALNVTKAALYYYVKGKRELLFETQTLALDMGDIALEEGRYGKTGLEKLERTIGRFIVLVTDDFVSHAFVSALDDMLPEHQEIVRKRRRAFDLRIREYIQEGIEDGSIAPCEPKLAVAWLMGSINWIPSWFNPEGDCGPEAIAEVFVNFMSHGLATGSAKIRTRPRKTSVKAA